MSDDAPDQATIDAERPIPPGAARPYAFGEVTAKSMARLAGLDRLGERIARTLRLAIEPMARAKTPVAADSIGPVPFESWLRDLPEFMSLTQYRMGGLKGGALVAIEAGLITRLVDAFYGGSGKVQRDRAREFTPIEDRLIGKLNAIVSDALAQAWSDVVALDPVAVATETNPSFVSFVRGDEQVVLQSFTVTPGAGPSCSIAIVYTAAGLRPLEPQLAAKAPGGGGESDADWRARMADALQSVQVPVRTVLARPEMMLSELMALKVGDVIPVTLPARAPLIVADQHLALGTLGDREGKAALMVEHVFGNDQ